MMISGIASYTPIRQVQKVNFNAQSINTFESSVRTLQQQLLDIHSNLDKMWKPYNKDKENPSAKQVIVNYLKSEKIRLNKTINTILNFGK